MLALSKEVWMLFAARIVGGILSAANMPTVMAYVADITTEEERSKGMGIIGAHRAGLHLWSGYWWGIYEHRSACPILPCRSTVFPNADFRYNLFERITSIFE